MSEVGTCIDCPSCGTKLAVTFAVLQENERLRSVAEALAEALEQAVFNGERYRAEAITTLAEYRAAYPKES